MLRGLLGLSVARGPADGDREACVVLVGAHEVPDDPRSLAALAARVGSLVHALADDRKVLGHKAALDRDDSARRDLGDPGDRRGQVVDRTHRLGVAQLVDVVADRVAHLPLAEPREHRGDDHGEQERGDPLGSPHDLAERWLSEVLGRPACHGYRSAWTMSTRWNSLTSE